MTKGLFGGNSGFAVAVEGFIDANGLLGLVSVEEDMGKEFEGGGAVVVVGVFAKGFDGTADPRNENDVGG